MIVLGAGFGDEGKGATVARLVEKAPNPMVIRFNGGHQAGHTVIKDGKRHVFSSFGSGTLHDAPTYWSKYCTVYPTALLNELKILQGYKDILTLNPLFDVQLFIDPLCPITTPFDIIANHHYEKGNQHGTVGVGFGQTIQRMEDHCTLYAQDLLFDYVLTQKLKLIQEYYGWCRTMEWIKMEADFIKDVELMRKQDSIQINVPVLNQRTCIFEGAQGIMLDQDFGFFPHVTRSNTTSKNAFQIIDDFNLDKEATEIYYVTRAYQTRHGIGPMSNEHTHIELKNNENETNITQTFQGEFRTGILDVDLLRYAIQTDDQFSRGLLKNLVITCTNQTKVPFPVTLGNKRYDATPYELAEMTGYTFRRVLVPNGA